MHVGIFTLNADDGMPVVELAREAEQRGFESLWLPEHTHIPASRKSPYPAGGELPEPYYRIRDPLVSLAAAAVVTERLRLGTGVCLLPQRDPIAFAKEAATLDELSGGRLLLGVGAGWNAEEMANHGVAFADRFRVLCERIEAITAIWSQEKASFRGERVAFEEIISYPKPVQRPRPPILMGGHGPHALARAARYADGWFPIVSMADALSGGIAGGLTELRRRAEEAGRDPAAIQLTACAFDEPDAEHLRRLRDIGAERAVLMCPRRREPALRFLESSEKLLSELA